MPRKYTSISVETTLSTTISASATSLTVANALALLGDVTLSAGDQFTVAIDPETVNEEILFVTAANTGTNTLTVIRARGGTTGIIHNTGATIKHVLTGDDLTAFASAVSPISTISFTGGTSGTTTVQASAAASGTLTLPAATDTLVGRATTETLTNKTINAANNTLTGVVTPSSNDTLTNKNLTSGTNTFPTSLATLTGSQTLTNKAIDYNSNTLTNFPFGSQTLLSTTTLSGSSTTVSSISSAYNDLYVYVYGVNTTVSTSGLTLSFGAGNADCLTTWVIIPGGSTPSTSTTNYSSSIGLTPTAPSQTTDNSFLMKISNYGGGTAGFAGKYAPFTIQGRYDSSGGGRATVDITGSIDTQMGATPGRVQQISISTASGTFTAGTVKIYGVK